MKSAPASLQRDSSFLALIWWLLRALRREAGWRLTAVLALNALGVVARIATIGLILLFVQAKITHEPVRIHSWAVPSDHSIVTLSVWSASILLMAIVTAVSTYAGEAMNFGIARRMTRRFLDDALQTVARAQRGRNPLFEAEGAKAHSRVVMLGDTMAVIRTTLLLTGAVLPFIYVLVAVSVLFYLDAVLTMGVWILLVGYLWPFYKLNLDVVKASRQYDDRRGERSSVFGQLLSYATQVHNVGGERPAWINSYLNHPATDDTVTALGVLTLSRRKVGFLQDLFIGLVLCAILLFFGLLRAPDQQSWVPFLTFLIAFRYAATGIGSLALIATGVNRFVPQLQRLKKFVESDSPVDGCPDESGHSVHTTATGPKKSITETSWMIRTVEPRLAGSDIARELRAGDVVSCICFTPLDTFTLAPFCDRLTRNSITGRVLFESSFFCGRVKQPPPLPLKSIMTGRSTPDEAALRGMRMNLQAWGLQDEVDRLPRGLDTVLTADEYGSLSPLLQCAMFLIPGLCAERKVFIISWNSLATLDQAGRKILLERFRERAVLVVHPRTLQTIPDVAHWSMVFFDDGVRGIGNADWYKSLDRSSLSRHEIPSPAPIEKQEQLDLIEET